MTASTSQRGILNPRVGAEHFQLSRHAPADDLAPWIERHWLIRWDLRGQPPFRQEVLSHPCVNVVIQAGCTAAHGVTSGRFATVLSGEGQVVGTKFRPGAFYPFVGVSMANLTDRSIPLATLFGSAGAALEPAVLDEPDPQAQIALVEAFWRERLPPPDASVDIVVRVVQLALEQRDLVRVDELCARADVPLRALQRLFRRYVGVSPKWVLRRFRLHEAAERIADGGSVDWSALAHELGYCDQSHFVHDFKAQVGCLPSEYQARCAGRGPCAPMISAGPAASAAGPPASPSSA
jgi:AraC-like DNA-binding protein